MKTKEVLLSEFMDLVNYLILHGEMMKGLWYLQNPPSYIEDEPLIQVRLGELLSQLSELERSQRYGKFNVGFNMPDNIDKIVSFQLLRKNLLELGLKKVVDVGCFSGWIGKALSEDGISVHGIDILPINLYLASFYSTGTLATFEYCPVQQFGTLHPKQFDGAILFDVLEHTFDPDVAIRSIKKAVKDEGWIFINLPHPEGENAGKRASQGELDVDLKDLDLHEHLYSFSKREIERLLGKEKNLSLEIINNEKDQINWFIKFQV